MDRLGRQSSWLTRGSTWALSPLKIAEQKKKEIKTQLDRQLRDIQARKQADALRKKMAGTGSAGQLDRLAEAMKSYGSSPSAMRRFFRSAEGKACLTLLNRLGDSSVEGQLRARGLSNDQIGELRDHIFTHAKNTIASRIDARVKQTAAQIGKLVRDPAERSKLVAGLEKMKTHKERVAALARLGITGDAAKRIACSPRASDAELVRGLKATAGNLETLHRECLMAMQDPKRALGLFAMTQKGTAELRKALGVPSNGSFAGNCVDKGLADARFNDQAEALVKKFTMALASIVSGGVLACIVTSAAPALERQGEATTRRKAAEAGEALDLTRRGTVAKARRAEKAAKRNTKRAAITGGVVGGAGAVAGGLGTYAATKPGKKTVEEATEAAQSLMEKLFTLSDSLR